MNHSPQNASTILQATAVGRSIVLIDDSVDALFLQRTVLEMEGYQVHTAQSGTEALTVLRDLPKPDLVLLDLQMEDMSGSEFLEKLDIAQPDFLEKVPVVFLTGMNQVPLSKAVGFIRKPIEVDDFLKSVQHFQRFKKPTQH